MARATIKTIAQKAELSVGTVSRALKDCSSVKDKTKQRVRQIAEEIDYVRNLDGLRLRTGRTYSVAVVMTTPITGSHEWEGVEYTNILNGIMGALRGTMYRAAIYPVDDFASSFQEIRNIVEQRLADGIIISGTRPDDARISYMLEKDFPFVTYGMSEHFTPYSYVDANSQEMSQKATTRLIQLGHTNIVSINPPDELMYSKQRQRGYIRALQDAGIDVQTEFIATGPLTPEFGKATVKALYNHDKNPTAYICANEASALGVLSAFYELGIKFGKDAIVNATDDINVSAYFTPPITTYFLPIEETSKALGEFIIRRIEGEPAQDLQRMVMPQLIERQDDRLKP
ncbi:putative HTH-type transcriptional repressor ExuR [Pseudovibrio sp. W64]|uniref:LacI family transcriptional regulator n=1 Tax=Pseudovibrio sp. W64 TaxID=1735583 RepID=UPI0007AED46E|nr:LacI family transcriptional regulator [Pseudovibrio sp. W64]KZK76660.1 putative HTH-type transcriptional repressor ExuR [Pseudovibrio sp. W64]